MKDERPTHFDIFAGISAFAFACEREGFQTIGFSEINPYACAVLRKHWPHIRNYGDARSLGRIYKHIDLLTAGFPCQDISIAGPGEGLEGKRSGLWFWTIEFVRRNRPVICLFENVPALRTRGADRVLSDLEKAGYSARAFVVEARHGGSDQTRKRVYIVAYTRGVGIKGCFTGGDSGTLGPGRQSSKANYSSKDWRTRPLFSGVTTPILCRGTDGIPDRLHRINALGNSIDPHIALIFARAIYKLLRP